MKTQRRGNKKIWTKPAAFAILHARAFPLHGSSVVLFSTYFVWKNRRQYLLRKWIFSLEGWLNLAQMAGGINVHTWESRSLLFRYRFSLLSTEFFPGSDNVVVKCSVAQLKHTLPRNISAGHSWNRGKYYLTELLEERNSTVNMSRWRNPPGILPKDAHGACLPSSVPPSTKQENKERSWGPFLHIYGGNETLDTPRILRLEDACLSACLSLFSWNVKNAMHGLYSRFFLQHLLTCWPSNNSVMYFVIATL